MIERVPGERLKREGSGHLEPVDEI